MLTRSEIIIVAIIGPRVKKRVPRVCFDEIVSGERRSSEREKDPSLGGGLHCGIIVNVRNAFCNRPGQKSKPK